jgi:hypothetical protein
MKCGLAGALLIVALSWSAVQAEGEPSTTKLAGLGLGSLQVVSDAQGAEVRGRGFTSRAFAAGNHIATTGTAASGPLIYNFATQRRQNAAASGNGLAVSNFSQVVNGQTFVFSANSFGASAAFAP